MFPTKQAYLELFEPISDPTASKLCQNTQFGQECAEIANLGPETPTDLKFESRETEAQDRTE